MRRTGIQQKPGTELKRSAMPKREKAMPPRTMYLGRSSAEVKPNETAPSATWTDDRGCVYGYARKDPGRPGRQERRRRAEMGQRWCRGCRDWLPSDEVTKSGTCRPCSRREYQESFQPTSIRQLKAGDPVPEAKPRRYVSGQGYARLRWKVGPRAYVEVYEHRVIDGRVTDAEHVHHKNRNRVDNRPENLEHLTAEEHRAEHGQEARKRASLMAARYVQGRSLPQIGREFGLDSAVVYRALADLGVQMRTNSDYAKELDADEVIRLYVLGRGYTAIGRDLGVSQQRVRNLLEAAGVPLRGSGRVRGRGPQVGEGTARRLVYARSGGDCEARLPEVCLGRATNWHHRKNRSQGGKWLASHGLHICGSGTRGCHGALTDTAGKRAVYEAAGLIVPSHKEPADVPVEHARLGRVFLLDNGDTKPAPKRKKAAA